MADGERAHRPEEPARRSGEEDESEDEEEVIGARQDVRDAEAGVVAGHVECTRAGRHGEKGACGREDALHEPAVGERHADERPERQAARSRDTDPLPDEPARSALDRPAGPHAAAFLGNRPRVGRAAARWQHRLEVGTAGPDERRLPPDLHPAAGRLTDLQHGGGERMGVAGSRDREDERRETENPRRRSGRARRHLPRPRSMPRPTRGLPRAGRRRHGAGAGLPARPPAAATDAALRLDERVPRRRSGGSPRRTWRAQPASRARALREISRRHAPMRARRDRNRSPDHPPRSSTSSRSRGTG